MKQCVLLLLVFACAHGAPTGVQPSSSCKDPVTNGIAEQAIGKVNMDRNKGYILSLERVSNVFQKKHGETGVVYYLTIDVLETDCHVLSKKNWKDCQTRSIGGHPVYGQCKVAIYVNKPKRIFHLYKYSCNIRSVTASKIGKVCPDCPTKIQLNSAEVEKTMKMGLEKFNTEGKLANYFAPLEITRATMQGGIANFVNVEFTIQETVCSNHTDVAELSKCNLMTCEFAHKGFCKASHASSLPDGSEHLTVNCEIYEPEAAVEEKEQHLRGNELDHHHENIGGGGDLSNSHDHSHDHTAIHSHPPTHDHDHAPDTEHEHKDKDKHSHDHSSDSGHHHTHEHDEGHGIAHGHAHSHEHSHDHDHSHVHHGQAHNHTLDQGFYSSHHNYGHAEGETHEHDHEVALDHEHKHGHLHDYEHHHHHHQHPHDETKMRKPEGIVFVHPALDQPTILPFFPDLFDKPDIDVGHHEHKDAHTPGEEEPTIGRFPIGLSPNCPSDFKTNMMLIKESFTEDPLFKITSAA